MIVRLDGHETELRCPSLLGAILLKCRASMSPQRVQDREDLVRLFLCVEDPNGLRADLKKTERNWLADAEGQLNLNDPALLDQFSVDELQFARATYELLKRS